MYYVCKLPCLTNISSFPLCHANIKTGSPAPAVIARPVTDPIMIQTSSVFSILLVKAVVSLEIVRHSGELVIVKEGGQLELFCDTSSPYQWCMWSHNG